MLTVGWADGGVEKGGDVFLLVLVYDRPGDRGDVRVDVFAVLPVAVETVRWPSGYLYINILQMRTLIIPLAPQTRVSVRAEDCLHL